jgi:hypothetical protein
MTSDNFLPSSRASINGDFRATRFVNTRQLVMTLNAAGVESAGTCEVTVENPSEKRSSSVSNVFDIVIQLLRPERPSRPVRVGGGTLKFTYDPVIQASLINYVAQIQPYILGACGKASDSATVRVIYDPTAGTSFFTAGPTPTITFPSPSGPTNDMIFHEVVNAQINALDQPPYGPSLGQGTKEGLSLACQTLAQGRMTLAGLSEPFASSTQYVLAMDTFTSWPAVKLVGTYGWMQVPLAAYLTYAAAIAPSGTLQTNLNAYSIAPLYGAYFEAFADAQGPVSAATLVSAANTAAGSKTIDGVAAGTWLGSKPFVLENPSVTAGTYLAVWTGWSMVNPNVIFVQAFTVSTDGQVALLTVPVTITILDNNKTAVLPAVATDTAKTQPYYLSQPLYDLAPGVYTAEAKAVINGVTVTAAGAFFRSSYSNGMHVNTDGTFSFPGNYFITVDAQGYAVKGIITVTSGTVVWSAPGVAIVDANPPNTAAATATVNGTIYTQPRPWARLIPIVQ